MTLNGKLELRVFESIDALEGIRPDWERLSGAYPHSTTFSTSDWLVPWWHAFGARDRVLAIGGYSGDSLVGLAPLSICTQREFGAELSFVRLMGDGTSDSDNLDVPAAPGHEAAFTLALFDWLENQTQAWDVCQLRTLPAKSPVAACFVERLRSRGWLP